MYDGCRRTAGDNFWKIFQKADQAGKRHESSYHFPRLVKIVDAERDMGMASKQAGSSADKATTRHGQSTQPARGNLPQMAPTAGSSKPTGAKSQKGARALPSTTVPQPAALPPTAAKSQKGSRALPSTMVPQPAALPSKKAKSRSKDVGKGKHRARTPSVDGMEVEEADNHDAAAFAAAEAFKKIKEEVVDPVAPLLTQHPDDASQSSYSPSKDGDDIGSEGTDQDEGEEEKEQDIKPDADADGEGEMDVDVPAAGSSKTGAGIGVDPDVQDAPAWIVVPNTGTCRRCKQREFACMRQVAPDAPQPLKPGACLGCRGAKKGCSLSGRKAAMEKEARRQEAEQKKAQKLAAAAQGAGPEAAKGEKKTGKKPAVGPAKRVKPTEEEKAAAKAEKKRLKGLSRATRNLGKALAKSQSGSSAVAAPLASSERKKFRECPSMTRGTIALITLQKKTLTSWRRASRS